MSVSLSVCNVSVFVCVAFLYICMSVSLSVCNVSVFVCVSFLYIYVCL